MRSRFDWNAADFGYPGQVTFHTGAVANRYFRVFKSNPLLEFADGICRVVDARKGYLDIQFIVDSAIYDRVLEALGEELRQLDGPSD